MERRVVGERFGGEILMQLSRKTIICLSLSLLLTMVSFSMASAASINTALTVPTVGIGPAQTLGTVQILETTYGAVASGMQIMVTLPPNSSYVSVPLPATTTQYVYLPPSIDSEVNALAIGDVVVANGSSTTTLLLNIVHVTNPGHRSCIQLLFNSPGFSQVNINGGVGDFQIHIFEATGAITSGTVGTSRTASSYVNTYSINIPSLTAGSTRTLGVVRMEENMPGALSSGIHSISLTLPPGVFWKGVAISNLGGFLAGDVTVNGIDVDEYGRSRLWLDVNHNSLHSTVSTAGAIEITGTVDIEKSVLLGDLNLYIGGTNAGLQSQVLCVAKITVASGEQHISRFVIGSTSYTLNNVKYIMEAAPYIKNSRTYLPLYYVARTLDIEDSNISWNAQNQTILLKKGDKIVQLMIGSNIMLVNGSTTIMEAVPEIKNGRTCLPISAVAATFGFTASWDASNQIVSIQ